MMAARSAPGWVPAKVQLRLPKAMPLNARPAQFLVKQILPSSRKRAKSFPAPEHVVDRLQDLGGAREGFALTQQPGVHVLEKRLALFLAHGAPLVCAAAVDAVAPEPTAQPLNTRSFMIGSVGALFGRDSCFICLRNRR